MGRRAKAEALIAKLPSEAAGPGLAAVALTDVGTGSRAFN